MKNVRSLRQAGYKVRVLHFRNKNNDTFSEKGGKTIVQIKTPSGQEFEGKAVCSEKDNYNKRIGLQVALGRALLEIDKKSFSCRPTGWFISSGGPCGLIKD